MKQDYQTNTVEGARGFAEANYEPEFEEDMDYTEEEDYEEDDCNCGDPGCPCGGIKRGCL